MYFWTQNILSQSVECARSRRQSRTVPQSLRSSLDAGLRVDGLPALDLRDMVIEV